MPRTDQYAPSIDKGLQWVKNGPGVSTNVGLASCQRLHVRAREEQNGPRGAILCSRGFPAQASQPLAHAVAGRLHRWVAERLCWMATMCATACAATLVFLIMIAWKTSAAWERSPSFS